MACPSVSDRLRMATESLGPVLHTRASYRNPIEGVVPRAEFPQGTGYTQSTFEIGRSEPTSDEETWTTIAAISGDNLNGACAETYNAVDVGFHENTYKPASYGMRGPVICQDELAANWESARFWAKYMSALEKRSVRSITNRKLNVYMQYVPKHPCNSSLTEYAGDISTQPASSVVDLSDLNGDLPDSELTQEMLEDIARILIEEGATDPDTDNWITLGENGPEFPLLIGQWASRRLSINNSEYRSDYNAAFNGAKEANPVLKRIGAAKIIGNFRHIINPFPPRWKLVDGALTRVPTWTMSTDAANATKGAVAVINPDWRDASVAAYEGAIVLHPSVMTERVLRPLNNVSGTTFSPKNYYGEWSFVVGNDAFIGMDSCAGIADPLKTQGRHFGRYRTAFEPVFPTFGRLLVFNRCSAQFDTVTCT